MYHKLATVRRIAKELDINGTLEVSNKKNKRFQITLSNGTNIHFGQFPFNGRGAFIDHHDNKIKSAWQKRHSKILIDGEPAFLNIYSPEYYSWHLLW